MERVYLGDIDVKVAQDFVDTLDTNKVEVVELHAERDDSLMNVISKGMLPSMHCFIRSMSE